MLSSSPTRQCIVTEFIKLLHPTMYDRVIVVAISRELHQHHDDFFARLSRHLNTIRALD